MKQQSPARIYKSQQRGHIENELHRLHATFNFESYNGASRNPFGALNVLNDEILAPAHEIKRQVHDNAMVLLVPLVGVLEYTTEDITQTLIPGEIAVIPSAGTVIIKNLYEAEFINYLYITFSKTALQKEPSLSSPPPDIRNTLPPFLQDCGINGFMAILNGREETIYHLTNPNNGLFIFAINGAFEAQGRLLENRDGLALWDTAEAEIESLSENAILLLFEVPLAGFTA